MDTLVAEGIYFVSIIVLSVIFGEVRYRYKIKQDSKQKNNEEQANKKVNSDNGFHRSEYRVCENCCNSDSYGVMCLKCGQCGRKFKNGEMIKR